MPTQDAPVRVLHVLPDLRTGGGQRLVLELVRHADPDVRVAVAWLRPPDELAPAFADAGAAVHDCTSPLPGLAGAAHRVLRLRRALHTHRATVVHVHSDPDRKHGQVAALLTGTPVVAHLHSPWDHRGVRHPSGASPLRRGIAHVKGRARDAVERRTVRRYLAAGPEVAAFHQPLAHAPITTVVNGIAVDAHPPSLAGPERNRVRAAVGTPVAAKVLVCVGRLEPGKGQDTLVDLVPGLDAHLWLIGDGAGRPALAARAAQNDVADRVHLLGTRRDVPDLLAAADAFVFASVSEGLPLAVLEAMAAGLPIVAAELPTLRSVLADGAGALVPQGDRDALRTAVHEVLTDPARASGLGRRARAVVRERFAVERTAREVLAAYREVLSERARRARPAAGSRRGTPRPSRSSRPHPSGSPSG